MRIDAHQHFWHFDPVRDSWINDEMQVIQHDFLPADLQPILAQHGFDGCVAVQADQSEAQNDYLLQLAEGNAFIKGIIGWVDLQAENIEERLQHYRSFPLIKGFRHVLQGEADRALMLRPAFKRGIAALGAAGYTYDILIFTDQLGYSAELVAAFPDQPFVVDHIAKPLIKDGKLDGWKQDMEALAQHPNVYCKVSGMVTEADWKAWRYEDFVPYLDTVVAAFGMQRLMYGSDWPVCNVAGGYDAMLGILQRYLESFAATEQEAFWGGNAARFYNL
ncbi:L-fuconolactonase [Cnuella takakiae]|uniref:L-fuconolactonase n=1 Tax=Cnuella takakiae TaxID=1302690 RepID=A0A1M4T189_9BACT|nr:amidohydrolase family protein [Cnuella takakiae]OLY90656.1 amidohydrolase [Cnuella takakiae]SHE38243.1 L-fuconolactonase [Cnuella takakiae]